MEESVVLTATLRDEASAPLEGLKKEFDGATQAVEKSNKAQASSTKEASAIMATAMDRAGGASTDMAKALDQASGTGSSAWGKLKTSATGASNEAITAARKQATELSTSVKVQESALTHLEGAHRDSLHAQEQAAAGATAAQQRLDELRGTATTKASALTKAEATLADAQFKADRSGETAEQAARDLAIGRDDLAAATKRLGEVQDVAGQKLTGFASLTEGVTKRQRDAISTLAPAVAVAGGAMTAGFGVMLKTYADFDKAMSGVQAATHETTQNMRLLREEAIRVGADTAFSAGEAAQGIEELAKAGVSTGDILKGGLAGALDLAAAGELGVGEAAEIAATAMTQFKLSGDKIPHLADLLAAGAGKAQGGVTDLGAALNQSGLVAAAAGANIEETTGTLAAFASAGLIGSDAGTSLKTMLQRLQNPSKKAALEMEELGINMYDANGEFGGMHTLAGQLTTGMSKMTQEQRDASMAIIFGSDAVRAANVLYTQGEDGINNWTAAVNDAGYAAKTAQTMQDNLAGDLEKLGGSFDTVFLKSGGSANDVLRDLVQILESVVDWVGRLSPEVLGTIGVVTGLTGGTLLLVGTIGMLAPKIKEGRAALRDLIPEGERSDKVMRGVGAATSVASKAMGLATVAVVALGAAIATHNAGLAKAKGPNAFAADLEKIAAGGKNVDGMFTNLDFGDSTAFEGKINGIGDALANLNRGGLDHWGADMGARNGITILRENVNGLDQALASAVSSGNAGSAATAWTQITDAAKDQGVSMEKLNSLFPGYVDALAGVDTNSEKAAAATEIMDTALEETGVTVSGLVEDMEKFLELLFATGLATMSARDASAAFHEATRGTADAIKAATEAGQDALQADLEAKGYTAEAAKALAAEQYNLSAALLKNKSDFDITTAAGAALNEGFQEIARAGMADIEAASKAGMGQDELQVKLRTTYDALIKDANAKGIAGQAAHDLARDVMGIPAKANIGTWMDDRAKAMAEETKTAVEAVPGDVNVKSSMESDALTMAERTTAALNGIPSLKDVTVRTNHVEVHPKQSMGETIANSWKAPGASGGAVFMAGGGVIPGYAPGVDDVPVIASRGESILVPELTRAIGPANIMALNHEYSGGRAAGAGPARSALSTVLELATSQTRSSSGVTATMTSVTPAAGGAVLADYASAPASFAPVAPGVTAGQPSGGGREINVHEGGITIRVSVGSDANPQDIAETVKAAVAEAIEELENEQERAYA